MRLTLPKIMIFVVLAFLVGSAIYRIFGINRSVNQAIAQERSRQRLKDRVPFEKTDLSPHDQEMVQIFQNTRVVRDLIVFRDSYFGATSGGLVQISPDGKMIRHYSVLDGLPESDLTTLISFDGRLYIGTRTSGLVVFDGDRFTLYRFTDRSPQAITSFLQSEGLLLIGTFNGGLIEFDGKTFTEIRAAGARIEAINCLRSDGPRLYVGTFDNGVFIYENDIWMHHSSSEGLQSNRVVGIELFQNSVYVVTDFGVTIRENDRFRSVAIIPALGSSAVFDGRLLVAKDNGDVYSFDKRIKEIYRPANGLEHARLVMLSEKLCLVSNQGISIFDGTRPEPFTGPDEALTDNFVSALALDSKGDLWAGTFRRGIDVLTAGGEKLKHIETDAIREVNYLQASGDGVSAATSGGMVNIPDKTATEVLAAGSGLPSSSVTHFSGDFIATAKGLAFFDHGRLRVLSTVQGLPGNSVYTTLLARDKLYAGTLGGLAEIGGGRIERTFTDSNSNLRTNWVTGLCLADDRLFIGTYGGGVFELSPSGEIRSLDGDAGRFTVNPNAMYADAGYLYVGTLTGVRVLDLETGEWRSVNNILPSQTVMSITGSAESVYFGTTAGIARVNRNFFAVYFRRAI